MNKFVFMGPQGVGKGTQAQKLSEDLGIPQVSTGDLFRAEIGSGTQLGIKVQALIKDGKLVPDYITSEMVANRIKEADVVNGYILDGYPRNINQLNQYLDFDQPDLAILIELDEAESVRRLSGRKICGGCGKIYHLDYNRPKVADICDDCGGSLLQRSDDKPEAIRERLRIYHEDTEPLVEKFKEMGILKKIDGSGSIENVYKKIKAAIE